MLLYQFLLFWVYDMQRKSAWMKSMRLPSVAADGTHDIDELSFSSIKKHHIKETLFLFC